MTHSAQLPLDPPRKSVRLEFKQLTEEGEFEAVFSRFNVIDYDGDVTLPGAFEDGAEVIVGAYGHTSWMGELPVGKGVIKQTDEDARIVGAFWIETRSGKEHYDVVKRLGPMQEWSYGYDILGVPRGAARCRSGADQVAGQRSVPGVERRRR